MNNNFVYTKAGTDITLRWKKVYGYKPASEQAQYIKKWADFRAICNQSVEDIAPKPQEATIYKWKRK